MENISSKNEVKNARVYMNRQYHGKLCNRVFDQSTNLFNHYAEKKQLDEDGYNFKKNTCGVHVETIV